MEAASVQRTGERRQSAAGAGEPEALQAVCNPEPALGHSDALDLQHAAELRQRGW